MEDQPQKKKQITSEQGDRDQDQHHNTSSSTPATANTPVSSSLATTTLPDRQLFGYLEKIVTVLTYQTRNEIDSMGAYFADIEQWVENQPPGSKQTEDQLQDLLNWQDEWINKLFKLRDASDVEISRSELVQVIRDMTVACTKILNDVAQDKRDGKWMELGAKCRDVMAAVQRYDAVV